MVTRRLLGDVYVDGIDDENWPETDEPVHTSRHIDRTMDFEDPNWTPLALSDVRWGGECRLEMDFYATVWTDQGGMRMQGWAYFYEGTSESTHDEAARQELDQWVPKGTHRDFTMRLDNAGFGGGDWVSLRFSLDNLPVEEPE